jgi:lysophospholipase L1-like esterase
VSTFPSAIKSFTNPLSTDYQDLVPHATQHSQANDEINAIETKVGIDSSADTTSHDFKLSSIPAGLKVPVKATYTEINTATDDAKFVTPKSLGDSQANGLYQGHKVYCFGDSLTFGTGSGDRNYTQKLQDILGGSWTVVNEGIAGQTTTQLLARLNSAILDNNDAEFVIVWGGINDIYTDIAATTIEANLQAIYTAIAATGAKVISLNITPSKSNVSWTADRQIATDAVNTWIAGTATGVDYKIDAYTLVEDPATPDTLLPLYDTGDGLHLQQDGYYAVGTKVYTTVYPYWTTNSTNKLSDFTKVDGWLPFTDALAYYGTNAVFSDQLDIRDYLQKGDKIKFVQSDGTVKYFYVDGVPTYSGGNVNIQVNGGTDYIVGTSSIRQAYYSKDDNPQSFPQWFNWTPVLFGASGSAGPGSITTTYAALRIKGKTAEVQTTFTVANVGSWGGNVLLQLPVNPSTTADNSVQLLQQGIVGANGALTIQGYSYAISSAGVMNFVSAFNSTLLQWGTGLASSLFSIKASYEI